MPNALVTTVCNKRVFGAQFLFSVGVSESPPGRLLGNTTRGTRHDNTVLQVSEATLPATRRHRLGYQPQPPSRNATVLRGWQPAAGWQGWFAAVARRVGAGRGPGYPSAAARWLNEGPPPCPATGHRIPGVTVAGAGHFPEIIWGEKSRWIKGRLPRHSHRQQASHRCRIRSGLGRCRSSCKTAYSRNYDGKNYEVFAAAQATGSCVGWSAILSSRFASVGVRAISNRPVRASSHALGSHPAAGTGNLFAPKRRLGKVVMPGSRTQTPGCGLAAVAGLG